MEFWGLFDGTKFDGESHPVFGWSGCSPMMGCTFTPPLPMCSNRTQDPAGQERVSARVPQDWPSTIAAVELACSAGKKITAVEFASFGTPGGSCGTGFAASSCASEPSRTRAIVEQACVGKPACAVAADSRVFGTPCAGTLNLAVTVACG